MRRKSRNMGRGSGSARRQPASGTAAAAPESRGPGRAASAEELMKKVAEADSAERPFVPKPKAIRRYEKFSRMGG